MRLPVVLAVLGLMPAALTAADIDMPEWEKSESNDYILGGGLWPTSSIPDGNSVVVEESEKDLEAAVRDLSGAPPPIPSSNGRASDVVAVSRPPSVGRIEPASLKPVTGLRVPTPMLMPLRIEEVYAHELPPVEGELRDQYFERTPEYHLVDPQQLLTEQKSHDIERFLEYHADEARFDICLMLFGGTQEIPKDIDLAQKHQEWFNNLPVVSVAYFLEHPERTTILYSDEVKSKLSPAVFEDIFKSCVREAQVAETAFDQVERFAIELSIRLYWLDKLLERQAAGEVIASTAEELGRPEWQNLGGTVELEPEAGEPSRSAEIASRLLELPWLWLGLGAMMFSGILGSGWWWWRRDSLAAKPVLFPDVEMPSRLGGVYSGGGYVGISFDVSPGNPDA